MVKLGTSLLRRAVVCCLCGLGAASVALASPPLMGRGEIVTRVAGDTHLTPQRRSISSFGRLDLRVPTDLSNASDATSQIRFPSPRRTPGNANDNPGSANDNYQLPALGTVRSQVRDMGRAEEFVRRVHREGMPVVRLWESNSALLSLGLNQRGKPGLWLVQKIR
jgi:hypothetical protein